MTAQPAAGEPAALEPPVAAAPAEVPAGVLLDVLVELPEVDAPLDDVPEEESPFPVLVEVLVEESAVLDEDELDDAPDALREADFLLSARASVR